MTNQNDLTIATLERKLRACNDFLAATVSLKKALENDETKIMTDLIKRREQLIATIDGLDRRIIRYLQAGSVDRRSATLRQMNKIAEALSARIKQIVSANQECEAIAAGRCEECRKDMTMITQKEEGLQGYAQHRQRVPKFLSVRT